MHQRPTQLFDAYVFDLDGTIYLGEDLLPQVHQTLTALKKMEKRVVFLSNNPTHSRGAYASKLTRLGLPTPVEDVINSTTVLVDFLKNNTPAATLFVIGEQPLKDELKAAGFNLSEDARQIQVVIASFDRTFEYRKLQVAFDAIRAGARFFATNADRYCPVPGGGEPDAGALIAAIEVATNTKIEAVVGKPSSYMASAILARLGLPPEACLITGDRLETDVLLGLDAGMPAALTLTGATRIEDVAPSGIVPTYIIQHLGELLPG